MFGELYFDGVSDRTERGPLAIICSTGIDGNVADVYGETVEEAEKAARYFIRASAIYDAVMAEAKSPESRANWLRLILDEVDPYKTNMLLQDWLRGVIEALAANGD